MKTIQPDYYEEFCCAASECPMTCCMQWRIAVDEETLAHWEDELKTHVKTTEDGEIIDLQENGMCPFLDEHKLCKIVLKHGDKAISKTCQTFPREEHEYVGRVEKALTPGCPAVLDLLWKRNHFATVEKEEVREEFSDEIYELPEVLFTIRDWLLEIMTDEQLELHTALEICFLIVLDLYEMDEQGELEERFDEYKANTDLAKIQKALGTSDGMTEERLTEYNELFLDVSERYRQQKIYADFLESIAETAEKIDYKEIELWNDFEEKMGLWQKHIRKVFEEEMFSAVITPATECVADILVKIEWMAMEYAMLYQVLFLQSLQGEITYDKLQRSVCTIFRMMGYADEDIWEYMENSFSDVIWPWGYFSLLM